MAPHSTLDSTSTTNTLQSTPIPATTKTMPQSTVKPSSTTEVPSNRPGLLPPITPQSPCGHGAPQRGMAAFQAGEPQGRFGRLFKDLRPARYGKTDDESITNLVSLANAMTSQFDAPKDGSDGEESGNPALYTYLGQFIDHDLTFDPVSVLTKQQDPNALVDFRTPALDLDNLYGRGPNDQPYMYNGLKFQLGDKLTGKNVPDAFDLPRFHGRALIGDPRNDENMLVSQFHGLVQRFHNRMVDDNPQASFEEIQKLVRFHYQYVILHDFLERIIFGSVLDGLKTNGMFDRSKIKFFCFENGPFMPVEFSVACYRLGHSMIRPGYRLNDDDASLLAIFPVSNQGINTGLTGFKTIPPGRAIDWSRFIDIEKLPYGTSTVDTPNTNPPAVDKKRLQLAYRIDTSLVDPLQFLPDSVADAPVHSLPQRNLERAFRLELPSGQAVARAMHLPVLPDDQILIGKFVDQKDVDPTDLSIPITKINKIFADNCPLWTYVLAEARNNVFAMPLAATGGPATVNTPQLGPVGGRIVAEVFLGLLFADKSSVLSMEPDFIPLTGAEFKLKDFVAYALGMGPKLTKGTVQLPGFGPHGTHIMPTGNGTNGAVPSQPISGSRATTGNPVGPPAGMLA